MDIHRLFGSDGSIPEYRPKYHYATQVPASILAEEDAAATGGYYGNILAQQEGATINPTQYGAGMDPNTGYPIDPNTGYDIDPYTGQDIIPGQSAYPGSYPQGYGGYPGASYYPPQGYGGGLSVDPNTGYAVDPSTGLDIDPNTGQDIPAPSYPGASYYPQGYGGGYPSYYSPAPSSGYPQGYSYPSYPPAGYNSYPSTPAPQSPPSSLSSGSLSSMNLPPFDLTGVWQSQQNPGYQPRINSSMLSFGSNNSLNVPYQTTGATTIQFMCNPSIIAAQPPGAVIGTVAGANMDGSTNIGSTITWDDIHGDTWTRIQ